MLAEWTDQLSDFTDDQIKRGILNIESQFPPSLPEFKKLCLTDRRNGDNWQHKASPAYKIYQRERLLPDKSAKERSRAAMKAALQEIRGK